MQYIPKLTYIQHVYLLCYTSYSFVKKYDANRVLNALKSLCHMRARIFFCFPAWLVATTAFVYHLLLQTKGVLIEQMYKVWWKNWFRRRVILGSVSEAEEETSHEPQRASLLSIDLICLIF